MNAITIPLLRKTIPSVIAADIVSVQPMAGSAGIFTLKSTSVEEPPKQGDLRHSFFYGWQRYYGTQWVPEQLWWKIKLKGL